MPSEAILATLSKPARLQRRHDSFSMRSAYASPRDRGIIKLKESEHQESNNIIIIASPPSLSNRSHPSFGPAHGVSPLSPVYLKTLHICKTFALASLGTHPASTHTRPPEGLQLQRARVCACVYGLV
ncbi:unnamed protein product, partial [Iphiclides podalirius]